MKALTRGWPLLAAFFLCGCGSRYYLGRLAQERGDDLRAIGQYEKYLADSPSGARAGETHARLGALYAGLGRCLESRTNYETALRRFSLDAPWKSKAEIGLMNCPDYFPLRAVSRWVYGDSATRGLNMTLDWELQPSTNPFQARIHDSLYAGTSLVNQGNQVYSKEDWAILQKDGNAAAIPILRYPFDPGREWTVDAPAGRSVYRVESNDATVQTAAGIFHGCLKIRETNEKFPNSWEYVYYAPGIGKIKTSVGGPGYENPNTELIRYQASGNQTP